MKLFWIVFAVCLICTQATGVSGRANTKKFVSNCTSHTHHPLSISKSVALAKSYLKKSLTPVLIQDRLVVMILYANGFYHPDKLRNRDIYLECSLRSLIRNAMVSTVLDIFVWVPLTSMSKIPFWLTKAQFPRVFVMPMDRETFLAPCGLINDSLWAKRWDFEVDYYIMGRWRLTYGLDFAKEMGYKYHLQFDDDSYILSPISFVMVKTMRGSYDMATIHYTMHEGPELLLGLAEMAKEWIVRTNFTVVGPLFENFDGSSLDQLTTYSWNRIYYRGFFVITSVDYYFSEPVQDFLSVVVKSGKDVEGRWQEQGVMNMMRLLFVPKSRHFKFPEELVIEHDRLEISNFNKWCKGGGYV